MTLRSILLGSLSLLSRPVLSRGTSTPTLLVGGMFDESGVEVAGVSPMVVEAPHAVVLPEPVERGMPAYVRAQSWTAPTTMLRGLTNRHKSPPLTDPTWNVARKADHCRARRAANE